MYTSHNDWMEILAGYGLFGFIVYIYMFYYLIRIAFHNKKNDLNLILITIILISIIISMTSRWYSGAYTPMIGVLLPYIIAKFYKEDSGYNHNISQAQDNN